MNGTDFNVLVEQTIGELRRLMTVKGGEYAGSEDRLANFKRGAALTGCTPMQVALIYAAKHYDAVCTYIRDQADGTDRPRSEPIEGRLDDLMNYCLLMKGLVKEHEHAKTQISNAGSSTATAAQTLAAGAPGPG